MKKSNRIQAFVDGLGPSDNPALHPCYTGYFRCFNAREYYEAHDVLEHLWLQSRDDANASFYKGLIQLAGAFVHLRKQHLRPDHPKDGRRLRPAARLFHLALGNLDPFRPRHLNLDIDAVCDLCTDTAGAIAASNFTRNPWHPAHAPQIQLLS